MAALRKPDIGAAAVAAGLPADHDGDRSLRSRGQLPYLDASDRRAGSRAEPSRALATLPADGRASVLSGAAATKLSAAVRADGSFVGIVWVLLRVSGRVVSGLPRRVRLAPMAVVSGRAAG